MDDEKLIECVRQNQVLYDVTHPKYMDKAYKSKIWKEIGEILKQSDIVCKNRWQNMRDQFKKNLQRRTAASKGDRSGKKMFAYKYEDSLQFIIPYYSEKESKETNTIPGIEQMVQTDELPPYMEDFLNENFDLTSPDGSFTSNQSKENFGEYKENTPDFLDTCIGSKTPLTDLHPMDAFLFGLSCTLKTFTPYYQNLAKTKLFSIVQSLELEQINPKKEATNPKLTKVEVTKTYYTPSPIIISGQNNNENVYIKHMQT